MDWKRQYLLNTVSSYAATLLRLALGLFLFRLLFGSWDKVEFGFWSLLWSLFGFGILLDFGLGITVQKSIGTHAAQGRLPELSRLLSTVFWTFSALGVGLFLVAWLVREPALNLIGVPPEHRTGLGLAYLYFFGGLAVTLPVGLFPVMLDGLQRMDIANWIRTLHAVLHFTVMWLAVSMGWSFSHIMLLAMVSSLVPNLIAAGFAWRLLKGVSLHPRHLDPKAIREQLAFSITAYLITFSSLVLTRTDQTVIATLLGVAFVTIYQAGYKLSEMMLYLSQQIERAVGPAAAHMAGAEDTHGLRDLLLKTSRLMIIVTTPCYLVTAFYMEPLIRVLTGMESVPQEATVIGQLLVFSVFNAQVTVGCAKRVLMMSGHEKSLLKITSGHAVANLVLSIVLARTHGVVGVAFATAVTGIVFHWFVLLPKVRQFADTSWRDLGRTFLSAAAPSVAVFAVLALLIRWWSPLAAESASLISLGWRGALLVTPCLLVNWRNLKALWA